MIQKEITEDYLKSLGHKTCYDFMVDKYIERLKTSDCPCLDEPGFLLYSLMDNNQMIYISNHKSFRGILENDKNEVFYKPYKNKIDVINFVEWFYITRKLDNLMEILKEHCVLLTSLYEENVSVNDLSEDEIKDLLFHSLIGANSINGLYCQKQASVGCCFYDGKCNVQGV